jgi:hypothetical protein
VKVQFRVCGWVSAAGLTGVSSGVPAGVCTCHVAVAAVLPPGTAGIPVELSLQKV